MVCPLDPSSLTSSPIGIIDLSDIKYLYTHEKTVDKSKLRQTCKQMKMEYVELEDHSIVPIKRVAWDILRPPAIIKGKTAQEIIRLTDEVAWTLGDTSFLTGHERRVHGVLVSEPSTLVP